MTNSSNCYLSLDEALNAINSSVINSTFENGVVVFLKTLNIEDQWQYVKTLLSHPKANIRTLGLRVVRRQFKDPELLRRVIQLCFSVERLAELQIWYTAILARYPMEHFTALLKEEIAKRADVNFTARHIRALQMHKAEGCKVKKLEIMKLMKFATERGLFQQG
jgi:hypothetical protein